MTERQPLAERPDLVVVGAGPAGLVTAIHARLRGLSVVVLERRTPKVGALDKACGEGLMPGGVAQLQALGVHLDPQGVHAFSGIVWQEGVHRAEAGFPHGVGLGIRRLALSRGLRERALELGAQLRYGVSVSGLVPGGVQSSQGPVLGGLVVGADGLHSQVRKWAGLSLGPGPVKRYGLRRHVRITPWTDRVEVHMAKHAECYLTPVGPEQVGVAFLWSGSKQRYDSLLAQFPAVQRRLGQAPQISKDMGSGPLHQRVRGVIASATDTRGPVALVGDASAYLDACTGEGLSLGFKQARALVESVVDGALQDYPGKHRSIVRTPLLMMRGLLWAGRVGIRPGLVWGLSKAPWVFSRVLAANDGVV